MRKFRRLLDNDIPKRESWVVVERMKRVYFAVISAVITLFFLVPHEGKAFHIIGGEITYDCLGIGQDSTFRNFRFTMKVYRDCAGQGANFDSPATIGVYREVNGIFTFVRTVATAPLNIRRVPPPEDPCLIVPPGVCVEEATYEFTISNLPVINGSYHVFWRRCCRNITINNIRRPDDTGATYTVEITSLAQEVCNDSPTFKNFPPTVICVGEPLVFDHSARDFEGDQLVYEFCAPLEGGGPAGGQPGTGDPSSCNGIQPNPVNCPPPDPPVTFIGPTFTPQYPLAGNPRIEINASSGRITGTPEIQGQFVVGVCAKEYRNGELLSVLRRDFQFNVSTCEIAVTAELEADSVLNGQNYILNSCGENTITFINDSYHEENIQSYEWTFDIGGTPQLFNVRDATVTFPGVGTYTGVMILNKGLSCADTATISVNIYPSIDADFEFEYDTCFGAPVEFTDQSFTGSGQMKSWDWSFGDGLDSDVQNPRHLYPIPGEHLVNLAIEDVNQCRDTATKLLSYFPVPPVIVVEPTTFVGCTPATIKFNNLSVPIDSTYDIIWDFGDGGQSFDISPTHTYNGAGDYSISIDITSPIGCFISAEFPSWITVQNSPEAGFGFSPQTLTSTQSTVSFFDESVDASAWQWTFGSESIAFIANPSYTFRDTGLQLVRQVVFHQNGCTDTAEVLLDVAPEVAFFLPNAFTPNNDGTNDGYRGTGSIDLLVDFEMTIWSRWGELVFETNDPLTEWNGKMNNTGEDMPMGVYVCKVKFKDPRGNLTTMEEFATLIR